MIKEKTQLKIIFIVKYTASLELPCFVPIHHIYLKKIFSPSWNCSRTARPARESGMC